MSENSCGFLPKIDKFVERSKWLNRLVDTICTILFPQATAMGCTPTYPFGQGGFCWDGQCEGVPYHGYLCSYFHVFKPRYYQPDGTYCDGPCPSWGGDAYITRDPCSGPCAAGANP